MELQAKEFVNCNCAYGCPCQFNALPTHGDCRAIAAYDITKGRYGDIRLAGLKLVGIFSWPSPIHKGSDLRRGFASRVCTHRMTINVEARMGKVNVKGFIEMRGEPIRDPVAGAEHRAWIGLPNGFEYTIAEMGSGSSKANGPIAFEVTLGTTLGTACIATASMIYPALLSRAFCLKC